MIRGMAGGMLFIIAAPGVLRPVSPLAQTPQEFQRLFGPAPDGAASVVAQRIIRQNFDESDCPLVVAAQRLGDGSIAAQCNNGERYRVTASIAMRCSAAAALGISGC